MFENRMLRIILGPKTKVTGRWRKFYTQKLHSLYSAPNIIRTVKSKGNLKVRANLGELGEEGS
jgi:hypothetical protein